MQAFDSIDGLVVPLDRTNIDTDAILPKQYLKMIGKTGFGPYLFDEWRYQDRGEPEQDCSTRPRVPDFPLNQARYEGAQILLARENFGCGSSREHAPWALRDWGIRALIAPSFAEIFHGNCFKNGLLPIVLDNDLVDRLFVAVARTPGYRLQVDLAGQSVTLPDGSVYRFDIDPFRKDCLLRGLDEIGLTLQHRNAIAAFEQGRRTTEPWLFNPPA
nr:3-isopropylmalate dehydratase small subunit [uncultured Ralstonia sp.]